MEGIPEDDMKEHERQKSGGKGNICEIPIKFNIIILLFGVFNYCSVLKIKHCDIVVSFNLNFT